MKTYIRMLLAWSMLSATAALSDEPQLGLDYWNKIDAEAVTTGSGLQYKVVHMGKGRKPGPKSTVTVHYRGLLLNGAVFDTSYNDDEPIELSLKTVIAGWREGIPLMPVGSVFVFLIPPELAYGDRASNVIPPNATLIFEIELYSIE